MLLLLVYAWVWTYFHVFFFRMQSAENEQKECIFLKELSSILQSIVYWSKLLIRRKMEGKNSNSICHRFYWIAQWLDSKTIIFFYFSESFFTFKLRLFHFVFESNIWIVKEWKIEEKRILNKIKVEQFDTWRDEKSEKGRMEMFADREKLAKNKKNSFKIEEEKRTWIKQQKIIPIGFQVSFRLKSVSKVNKYKYLRSPGKCLNKKPLHWMAK